MSADAFPVLLAATATLRGLGAGAIAGVVLIAPARPTLGIVRYAQFTRAQYRSPGVRLYAATTILGALLTAFALAVAVAGHEPPIVIWSIVASLVATALGFVGTARALPAMTGLWDASDEDELLLAGRRWWRRTRLPRRVGGRSRPHGVGRARQRGRQGPLLPRTRDQIPS